MDHAAPISCVGGRLDLLLGIKLNMYMSCFIKLCLVGRLAMTAMVIERVLFLGCATE
jgi:hypothetical protein